MDFVMPVLPLLFAALVAAAPPPKVQTPAWIEDAATQILARAMVEEARARTGVRSGDVVPTREDMVRALTRCLENADNLLLLSGLVPAPRAVATTRPAPVTRRGIRLSELEAAEQQYGRF
jgi:hypothetical protein